MLPELRSKEEQTQTLGKEYSSADRLMNKSEVAELLKRHKLMVSDRFVYEEDMLAWKSWLSSARGRKLSASAE